MNNTARLLALALAALPAAAHADTLEFAVGMFQTASFGLAADHAVDAVTPGETELRLRLRLFDVLGAELAVGSESLLAGRPLEADELQARLSGLLFLSSGETASFYLRGGVGTNSALAALRGDGGLDSVHAGLGLEFYITDFLALAAEVDAEADISSAAEAVLGAGDVVEGLESVSQLRGSVGLRLVL